MVGVGVGVTLGLGVGVGVIDGVTLGVAVGVGVIVGVGVGVIVAVGVGVDVGVGVNVGLGDGVGVFVGGGEGSDILVGCGADAACSLALGSGCSAGDQYLCCGTSPPSQACPVWTDLLGQYHSSFQPGCQLLEGCADILLWKISSKTPFNEKRRNKEIATRIPDIKFFLLKMFLPNIIILLNYFCLFTVTNAKIKIAIMRRASGNNFR